MKITFFIRHLVYITFAVLFSCKDKIKTLPETSLTFKKNTYVFDTIKRRQYVTAIFNLTNTGNQPLQIQDVKTSCGCIALYWSKDLIKQNNKGIIEVRYDAKRSGHFTKTITVFYNGKDSPKKLFIKGQVMLPHFSKNIP